MACRVHKVDDFINRLFFFFIIKSPPTKQETNNVKQELYIQHIRFVPTYCTGIYQHKKYRSYSNMFQLVHATNVRGCTKYDRVHTLMMATRISRYMLE